MAETRTTALFPDDDVVGHVRADITRAVRKICPRWLADQADDLIQVATGRVLNRIAASGDEATFSQGYLYRAVYSAVVDEIRHRRRLREVPLEPQLSIISRAADPERRTQSAEIRAGIEGCLGGLAEDRRRAVMLHLQGHSLAETSALLACDRKRTENLVYRGLADLRECLSARGLTP